MRVRIGHPGSWGFAEVERRLRDAVDRVATRVPAVHADPPEVRASGFRAQGYALDRRHPLVRDLARAHAGVHGSEPAVVAMGSTTDARVYLNRFGVPAVCYGPRTRNIHGVDEAVELDSIRAGAKALARFLAARCRPETR